MVLRLWERQHRQQLADSERNCDLEEGHYPNIAGTIAESSKGHVIAGLMIQVVRRGRMLAFPQQGLPAPLSVATA